MTNCNWCGCPVDERQADVDGNHRDFLGCIEALKRKVKALTQELIDERVITAQLTERLENCESCPVADYEELSMSMRFLFSNQAPEKVQDALRHLAFEHKITITMYPIVVTEDEQVAKLLIQLETAERLGPVAAKPEKNNP